MRNHIYAFALEPWAVALFSRPPQNSVESEEDKDKETEEYIYPAPKEIYDPNSKEYANQIYTYG
jgi:hypothetical protein